MDKYYKIGADVTGTFLFLLLLLCSHFFMTGESASSVARGVAYFVGVGLALSFTFDLRHGVRNMIRIDVLCLVALYFLTLFEFLFPQYHFDTLQSAESVSPALTQVMIAFACLLVGRHLYSAEKAPVELMSFKEIPAIWLVRILYLSAAVGYLHMLMAVNFNLLNMVDSLMGPRFAVPWQRAKLGGIGTLLNELALLFYVIPPLMGIIWHRRKEISSFSLLLSLALFLFLIFTGFCGGTRNVLAAYLAGFLGGYLLAHPKLSIKNLIPFVLLIAVLFFYAAGHMLAFRNIGLSRYIQNYETLTEGDLYNDDEVDEGYFVDYNLHAIAVLVDAFPSEYDYLGTELLWWSAIKPIPRALWPRKPTDLSTSIEEVMGATQMTVACTYIGEAYMSGGTLLVIIMSLAFGAACSLWNRLGGNLESTYSLIVFATGFFAFLLSMRSIIWFTTAILPCVALVVLYRFYLRKYL